MYEETLDALRVKGYEAVEDLVNVVLNNLVHFINADDDQGTGIFADSSLTRLNLSSLFIILVGLVSVDSVHPFKHFSVESLFISFL